MEVRAEAQSSDWLNLDYRAVNAYRSRNEADMDADAHSG